MEGIFLIDGFNVAYNNIVASSMKFDDKSMSAICFHIMGKGNLRHLSYMFRKLEPLGTEFNTVACSVTGIFLFLEVQIGKEGMNHSKYQQELG